MATITPKVETPARRPRISMSIPRRKLEVPDIEGFHLYWFLDRNVPQAIQAGYDFVTADEVAINQFNPANAAGVSGNTAVDSHVRVIGGTAENGNSESLNLMKIRREWYLEDQKILQQRNAQVLQAIFQEDVVTGDTPGQTDKDKGLRYVREALLTRPPKKQV